MDLQRRRLLLALAVLISAATLLSPGIFPRVHAAPTGLVCLRDPSAVPAPPSNPCASTAPIFDGPVAPVQIRIGVYINGSDQMNGFDITLIANHTSLKPAGVDTTGSVLPGSISTIELCMANVNITGPRCAGWDSVDTLHFAALAGTGLVTTAPTTGLLFTAIYNITATTVAAGTSIGFQTGCSGTSATPFCVTISNPVPSPPVNDPETLQTPASFNNNPGPPWVAVSSSTAKLDFILGNYLRNQAVITATAKNGWPGISTDSIAFSSKSSPAGLSASFTSQSCSTGGGLCAVTGTFGGTPGSYNITISGQYVLKDSRFSGQTDTLVSSVILQVAVRDFRLAVNPNSFSFNTGSSASSLVTVTSLGGFIGNVALSVSCTSFLPAGIGAAGGSRPWIPMLPYNSCPTMFLSPATVSLTSGGSATSTLTIGTPNAYGNFSILVNGDNIQALTHSVVIRGTINDFTMYASPAFFSMDVGSSSSSTISLTSQIRFSGTITLAATLSAPGLIVSFSPSSLTLSAGGSTSSVMTVTAPSGTPTGIYDITILAMSGGISNSITFRVNLNVVGFPILGSLFTNIITQETSTLILALGLLATVATAVIVRSRFRYS